MQTIIFLLATFIFCQYAVLAFSAFYSRRSHLAATKSRGLKFSMDPEHGQNLMTQQRTEMEAQLQGMLASSQQQHAVEMETARQAMNTQVNALIAQFTAAVQVASVPHPAQNFNIANDADAELRSIINPKVLERIDKFSGKDEDFADFEQNVESVGGLLSLESFLHVAVSTPELEKHNLMLGNLDASETAKTKAVYYLLQSACKGKAKNIIKSVEKHNGFLAWRALVLEYKPAIGGRINSMHMSILKCYN